MNFASPHLFPSELLPKEKKRYYHLGTLFCFAYLVLIVVTITLISQFTVPSIKKEYVKSEAQNLYNEATSLANNYGSRYYNNAITTQNLKDYLSSYASYLNSDIWVVDPNGNVNCTVQMSKGVAPDILQGMDITTLFEGNYYALGTFYSCFDEEYLSVYAPIIVKYSVSGYLMIHEPFSHIADQYKRELNKLYVTVIILLLLAGVIFGFCLYMALTDLASMLKVSREYKDGNFKPQTEATGCLELHQISDSMNFMATKLDTHEEEQRKFIANVSHDFRSPLTSIRGYLQAMLDGTIPPERYEKYLNVILKEADRLTSLTNKLLDLNRIGSRDFPLELSNFDVNAIILECAQSFEGQCTSKGIHLAVSLVEGEVMVHADKSKIQQVIYNLMDNAIKFSGADSTITVETTLKDDLILVSIQDQGIGIPKEFLDNIWNRFYKTDLSRGKDKTGTGLGLSIVKEIIQAHSEEIKVTSEVGKGTKFTFSLTVLNNEI